MEDNLLYNNIGICIDENNCAVLLHLSCVRDDECVFPSLAEARDGAL